jgi:hypothetical protein
MEYQIIPNLTYLGRPVYTRNSALPAAANAAANAAGEDEDDAAAGSVPPVNGDDQGQTYDWGSLTRIIGGKKRTRKYLSKNKRNSRKRRKSHRV